MVGRDEEIKIKLSTHNCTEGASISKWFPKIFNCWQSSVNLLWPTFLAKNKSS